MMKTVSFDLFTPTQEHSILRDTVRDFVRNEVEPQALEHDIKEKFNLDLFRKVGDLGLLGLTVPQEYGGAGMDAVASVIVHEELASSDPGFALAYLAHSVLFVNNFYQNSNDFQRNKYLSKVISGQWIGAMCMTEPDAGTDVMSMKTKAEKKGDFYYITGRKTYITNGAIDSNTPGDVFLVYAKTGEKEISTFVVEKGFEGFSLGQVLKNKTGMRSSITAELVFDNCKVPSENILGKEGDSLIHMMKNLEVERLTLAAISTGIAARCIEIMIDYSNNRYAFGKPIREFGQIQRYIADSYSKYMAARSYLYYVASKIDLNKPGHRVDTDGVKLFASTVAKEIADNAMQVLGGYGYFAEAVVDRMWRSAKLIEIGGGTIEAHQKNMTKDLTRYGYKIR
ncbi:MAG: acyl-CoA dehydrogenase family protein [Candidatus Calescibacterium sp.]|nr:acyl-CoA dehydrogenase family protein [Candidatus Calescibacterium sp.]MDW8132568.1 acyl-CoA dehydrogenase family protein [Candidatus Calescibacterium sp.]